MSADLRSLINELHKSLEQRQLENAVNILSRAKRALLQLNALTPSESTPPQILAQAREILELGAITSIRLTDSEAFTRYYQQLQPFYDHERHLASTGQTNVAKSSQRSIITGLYLLLLLSSGDSAQFHTVLEGLIVEASLEGRRVEDDPYIKYPVELERSLMEGSYDKVWRATKSETVPTEDFGLFSNILVGTIRREIAECSENAYESLPISNAKNLLFLDSEGAVVQFAQERGWTLRDGRIYFPSQAAAPPPPGAPGALAPEPAARGDKAFAPPLYSSAVIENTIGYARELETIV
ncbi:hypothetical protein VTN49DRAFT_7291 [Thermomyces lanuginosus]|uniref:uncharacterized protein n=1 Tax=Thermomyces lanuginosus TaxID=5541 RepID=UPI003743CF07